MFDSNPDIQSKRDLFLAVWKEYGAMVEYVPNAELQRVGDGGRTLEFALQGRVRADVANVIPPRRAPALVRNAGLSGGGDWCPVDFLTCESTLLPNVHVQGDGIASAPGLPKSGHMANQTGKVWAAAIAARLGGGRRRSR